MPDINRVVPTSTSGPLANERDTTSSPDRIEPRIMIVNATPSSASGTANVSGTGGGEMRGGYVGLMNCVFAAQKAVRRRLSDMGWLMWGRKSQ